MSKKVSEAVTDLNLSGFGFDVGFDVGFNVDVGVGFNVGFNVVASLSGKKSEPIFFLFASEPKFSSVRSTRSSASEVGSPEDEFLPRLRALLHPAHPHLHKLGGLLQLSCRVPASLLRARLFPA